jgi:hypothetical protein
MILPMVGLHQVQTQLLGIIQSSSMTQNQSTKCQAQLGIDVKKIQSI